MRRFDGYIAIDWSGADGPYAGISIARCAPGTGAPRLVVPRAARWTRTAIADWLEHEVRSGRRLLIGFDFAFGLPFEPGVGYLAGAAAGAAGMFALWELIEQASGDAADFGCANVLADPRFASLYWRSGRQPPTWAGQRRQAELACGATTGTYPECVFKLIGPKQVGKASLTGIRVLRRVRARNRDKVAVWPFEPIAEAASALVEIYPTLFRREAAGGIAKLRTRADLNAALRRLGSRGAAEAAFSDHDTDALISAAGLRHYIEARGYILDDVGDRPLRREGWIFGVPLPGDEHLRRDRKPGRRRRVPSEASLIT